LELLTKNPNEYGESDVAKKVQIALAKMNTNVLKGNV